MLHGRFLQVVGALIDMTMYHDVLDTLPDGNALQRNVSCDDASFGARIGRVLRSLLGRRPGQTPQISRALQGNLCEFCVWELGERHWALYEKQATWPANAKSPWRNSSKPGVDILAVGTQDNAVLVIEVKSSRGRGASAVTGNQNSLKDDFRRLFAEGAPDRRIWGSIQEVVTDLILRGESESAARIVDSVGSRPDECTGIRLIGVLVCRKGDTDESRRARREAFQRLHEWLREAGWGADQCEFRSVELVDFACWLSSFVDEVTR